MSESSSQPAGKSFVAHAQVIGLLTLLSRVLGMARESVAAGVFGAGMAWSAFTVAFTVPNLFRKLFGEGALSAAFIPLYASELREQNAVGSGQGTVGSEGGTGERVGDGMEALKSLHAGPESPDGEAARDGGPDSKPGKDNPASDFASASVMLLVVILTTLTIVGELILGAVMLLVDLRPDQLLTLKLTAIMLPYVLLICGAAFLSGILQVHKKFALPAFAPVLLNVIHIGVMVVGAWLLHLNSSTTGAQQIAKQTTLVYWLSGFVLVAGALQLLMLWPALRGVGFRFRFTRFWTPPVKKMLMLSIPVAMSAGVLQVSVLLDKGISVFLAQGVDALGNTITHFTLFGQEIAYPMQAGAVARLSWAQFLYQFPLGIFAIALATAIFPTLSADALNADRTAFKKSLNHGIEATLFEGIAASVGLILVAKPAIRLLFEHGSFTPADTELVYRSTVFYAAAIWAFSLQQILNRAYYALRDTKTPLIMSVVVLVVNTLVEVPLVFFTSLGEAGMAAGTLVSFALQAVVMTIMLDRRVGGIGLGRLMAQVAKMCVAAALMTWVCTSVQLLSWYPDGTSNAASLMQLLLLMGLGAVVYIGTCAALGVSILPILRPRRRTGDTIERAS